MDTASYRSVGNLFSYRPLDDVVSTDPRVAFTNQFSLGVKSASVAVQAVTVISISVLADVCESSSVGILS